MTNSGSCKNRRLAVPCQDIRICEPFFTNRKKFAAVWVWASLWVTAGLFGYFLNSRSTPPGYFADTLSIVMNAVCINEVGTDEFGVPYPIVGFLSLGDYKPPLFIYLVALASNVFGPSLYLAKIIGMLSGLLGVTITVLTARKLTSAKSFRIFGPLFFALALLSSWVMVPHRLGQDVTAVLPFIALLISASLFLLEDTTSEGRGISLGIVCGLLPYVHSATKFFYLTGIPLLMLTIFISHGIGALRWHNARGVYWAILVGSLMSIPFFFDLLTTQNTLARYSEVGESNILNIGRNYLRHVNPIFWFFEGDKNLRHHTGFRGMLNIAFIPALLPGLIVAMQRGWREKSSKYLYVLLFFIISFLPVSMTWEGHPHALRTLVAIPPIIILSFWGAQWLHKYLTSRLPLWVCLSILAVWCVGGGLEATRNVLYYHQHPCDSCWTYSDRPEPQWLSDVRAAPCDDRSMGTLNYRYFRLVEMKDTCYCRRNRAK